MARALDPPRPRSKEINESQNTEDRPISIEKRRKNERCRIVSAAGNFLTVVCRIPFSVGTLSLSGRPGNRTRPTGRSGALASLLPPCRVGNYAPVLCCTLSCRGLDSCFAVVCWLLVVARACAENCILRKTVCSGHFRRVLANEVGAVQVVVLSFFRPTRSAGLSCQGPGCRRYTNS